MQWLANDIIDNHALVLAAVGIATKTDSEITLQSVNIILIEEDLNGIVKTLN